MQTEESHTDLGTVKIHKKVISSIAGIAATEVEGVKCIGGGLKCCFLELLGKRFLSGIKVEIDKNDEVYIEISIIIKYGYNIQEVASLVQENIRSALEKMGNLSIKDININVQSIEKP